MVLVRDHLDASRLQELDCTTGRLGPPRAAVRPETARGVFMPLGRTLVVLYVEQGQLRLHVGEDAVSLERATAELVGENLRTLRIARDGAELARLVYPSPIHPFMQWDLGLAEEEDFDLGVFVRNVLASPARRRLFVERWS